MAKWNERAVVEWLFHIAVDNLETAYKESYYCYKDKTYNFYQFVLEDDGLRNVKFDVFTKEIINELFVPNEFVKD